MADRFDRFREFPMAHEEFEEALGPAPARLVDLGNPDDPSSEAYRRRRVRSPVLADLGNPDERRLGVAAEARLNPNLDALVGRAGQGWTERRERMRQEGRDQGRTARPTGRGGIPGIMGKAANALSTMSQVAAPDDEWGEVVPVTSEDDSAWGEVVPVATEGIPDAPQVPGSPVAARDQSGQAWNFRDQQPEGSDAFLQGASDPFGMGAEVYGASEALYRSSPIAMMTGDYADEGLGATYRSARDRREQELTDARANAPGQYLAGSFMPTAPLMAAAPVSVPGRLALGSGLGALQGLGQSQQRGAATLPDVARGAGVGLAFSGLGELGGQALGAVARHGSRTAERGARKLMEDALERGETLSPGGFQNLLLSAGRTGLRGLMGAAGTGAAATSLALGGRGVLPGAIANIERLARSSPEVALAWGRLLQTARAASPEQLAVWASVLGTAATPMEFFQKLQELQPEAAPTP
jgi:hypothetical protein